MRNVLWIGGPPGQTFIRIVEKLAADGINVAHVQEHYTGNIPVGVDAVLINVDMLDHGSFDMAKAAAKLKGIPYTAVRTDYSRTRMGLQSAGLISPQPKEAPMVAVVTPAAPNLNDPNAVRALLASIPSGLRVFAAEELAKLTRASTVQPAALAFITMCEAQPPGPIAGAVADFVELLNFDHRDALKLALQGH